MHTKQKVTSNARALSTSIRLAIGSFPALLVALAVPDTAAAQQDSTGIEEIVVTSQRREQNLQDVPISISAFTTETIEKYMFADVADYIMRTPNASFITNGAKSYKQISIRGITNFLGFVGSSTTGFYIDDFSVAGSTINPPIMDVERIEILRGPQATYFGRNALGGGISITSVKPGNDFYSSLMADYSKFDTIDTQGVLNVPLVDDTLAVRLNLKHQQSDGYIENVHPIGGGNDSEYQYAKALIRYTPTENLTVDTMWQYATENVGMREGVPSGVFDTFSGNVLYAGLFPDRDGDGDSDPPIDTVGFYPENRTRVNFNRPQDVGTAFRNGVIRVDYEFSDLLLTSVSGYINSDLFLNGDIDGGSGDYFHEYRNIEQESYSQEFRLQNSDDGRWTWNAGFLYAHDEGEVFNRTVVGAEEIFGLPNGFLIDREDSTNEADYTALFGQVEYALTDKLSAAIGGRYSEEKISADIVGFSGVLVTILSVEDTFTDFSPRLALTYTANDNLTFYGTVSKGFKSGGVQIAPDPERESFDPETLGNYEVGLKAGLLNDRLRLDAAVFYMDWEDLQVAFQENLIDEDGNFVLFGGTDNAEAATSKGAELSAAALISDNLLVNFSVGYLNAKFDRFTALIDGQNRVLDGQTIPNSPNWTLAADAEYGFALNESWDGYIRGEWNYRDEIRATTSAMVQSGFPWEVPSYDFFNLRIGVQRDNLSLVAYAENLFDSNYFTNAYEKANTGGLILEPSFRTYGLRATYEFGAQ
jgi:iron complex outermembrane receptor protein